MGVSPLVCLLPLIDAVGFTPCLIIVRMTMQLVTIWHNTGRWSGCFAVVRCLDVVTPTFNSQWRIITKDNWDVHAGTFKECLPLTRKRKLEGGRIMMQSHQPIAAQAGLLASSTFPEHQKSGG